MPTLAELRTAHRELAAIARGVCPAPPDSPVAAERARRLLAAFSVRLEAHLAAEAPLLAELAASPSTRLAGEVRAREAGALAESVCGLAGRWTAAGAIERDPAMFVGAWDIVQGALTRLIAREEGEIYPQAAGMWEPAALAAPPPTGIPELDADHAHVFALIGGLRATTGGGQRDAGAGILAHIVLYAERHFALEERLMLAADYPGLEDHRQEHHRAAGIILGFRNDHLDGLTVEGEAVLRFLEGWLTSHIAHTDQAMAAHLRACGQA